MSATPIFDEVAKKHPKWIRERLVVLHNNPYKIMARVARNMSIAFSKNKLGI